MCCSENSEPNMTLTVHLPGDGTTIFHDIGLKEPGWDSKCDRPFSIPPHGATTARDDILSLGKG